MSQLNLKYLTLLTCVIDLLALKVELESVSRANYSPDEGCLENTRKSLLAYVDAWLHGLSEEKTAWVHGYAGSGKSALLNSIAKDLESASIPFICFPCKRDDQDLSNIHKILPTLAYFFSETYDDYFGFISDLIHKQEGRSVLTGGIKRQSELLFGKTFELISPKPEKYLQTKEKTAASPNFLPRNRESCK